MCRLSKHDTTAERETALLRRRRRRKLQLPETPSSPPRRSPPLGLPMSYAPHGRPAIRVIGSGDSAENMQPRRFGRGGTGTREGGGRIMATASRTCCDCW